MLKRIAKRIPGAKKLYRDVFLRGKTGWESKPEGAEGVEKLGHREYVGGLWYKLGKLQFTFLVEQGLRPHHVLLDIACGSLRAGSHLIPYLDEGHYLGIDKEPALINAGIERELGAALYEVKKPKLLAGDDFNFGEFGVHPGFALAQSLFTHFPIPLIETCLRKLREVIAPDGVLYATFFEAETAVSNPAQPHSHRPFYYTREQMMSFGPSGWEPEYIGDWKHPRGQVMVRYRPVG